MLGPASFSKRAGLLVEPPLDHAVAPCVHGSLRLREVRGVPGEAEQLAEVLDALAHLLPRVL
eukprot:4401770-Alexandrium_andersonii.AAC.1